MFDRYFPVSKVGLAAIVSVAVMIAFNLYAFSLQTNAPSHLLTAVAPIVELA